MTKFSNAQFESLTFNDIWVKTFIWNIVHKNRNDCYTRVLPWGLSSEEIKKRLFFYDEIYYSLHFPNNHVIPAQEL